MDVGTMLGFDSTKFLIRSRATSIRSAYCRRQEKADTNIEIVTRTAYCAATQCHTILLLLVTYILSRSRIVGLPSIHGGPELEEGRLLLLQGQHGRRGFGSFGGKPGRGQSRRRQASTNRAAGRGNPRLGSVGKKHEEQPADRGLPLGGHDSEVVVHPRGMSTARSDSSRAEERAAGWHE
jgi:hypothetical protein